MADHRFICSIILIAIVIPMNPYTSPPDSKRPLPQALSFLDLLKIAFSKSVILFSLKMAAVVGTILVIINHGNCLLAGHFGAGCLIQSALTVLVPYTVATVSSVCALTGRMDCG